MKKIYMLLFAVLAFVATASAQVLIDTDFSDMNPVPDNGNNNLSGEVVAISNGTMFWHGSRYNDTSNTPFIGEVGIDKEEDGGDAVEMSPDNPDVRYIRTGSNPVITDGKPTNHYFQVTPDAEFVNGGKVSLTISVHSTGKGINVYDATDGVLLGTIDISQAVKYKKEVVEFTLPEDFSGVKTLAFTRADVDGEIAGVTFFTWHIKIETNVEEEEEETPEGLVWNISSDAFNALGVLTETTTVEGLTIYAADGNAIEVDANGKSLDGVDYTHRLKLNGGGNFSEGAPASRVLAFNVSGDASITIMPMSASSSLDRILNVGTAEDNILAEVPALKSELTATTVNYVGEATVIYLWSAGSGVNIYNIEVKEGVTTSISTPAYEGRVVSTQYYNINGMKVDSRFEALPAGIYIEVSRYENGAVATKKIIKGNR